MEPYKLIRSRRRTAALEITADGRVLVRAPLRMPRQAIDQFVARHSQWLETHLAQQKARLAAHPEPDEAQKAALIQKARAELPQRVEEYSRIMGLTPTGVRITGARRRFGSCSAKNSLCFSWRLMLYPQAAVDYVVVHELAHIAHKNHGPAFYACIAAVLPDYKARIRLLKD